MSGMEKIRQEILKNPNRTAREIAETLDLPYNNSVYLASKQLGVELKRVKQRGIIGKAIKENPELSVQEIADKIGVYSSSVWHCAKKENLKVISQIEKNEKIVFEEIERDSNKTAKEISNLLGLKHCFVLRCFRTLGKKTSFGSRQSRIILENELNPDRTIMEIAEVTDFGYNYVYKCSKRNGLVWKPDDKKKNRSKIELEIKKNPDRTAREIAEVFNTNPYYVQARAKRIGVKLKKELTELQKSIVENQDKSAKYISEMTEYKIGSILSCARKMGYKLKDSRCKCD